MSVTVYEDPITRRKLEGRAEFIRWLEDDDEIDGLRRAHVRFPGEGEDVVERLLHADDFAEPDETVEDDGVPA